MFLLFLKMSLTDLVILLSSIDGPRLGRLVIIYYKLGFKVARYSFSRSIPPKFEHKLLRHKQRFGKIATTVVSDKDENLL